MFQSGFDIGIYGIINVSYAWSSQCTGSQGTDRLIGGGCWQQMLQHLIEEGCWMPPGLLSDAQQRKQSKPALIKHTAMLRRRPLFFGNAKNPIDNSVFGFTLPQQAMRETKTRPWTLNNASDLIFFAAGSAKTWLPCQSVWAVSSSPLSSFAFIKVELLKQVALPFTPLLGWVLSSWCASEIYA